MGWSIRAHTPEYVIAISQRGGQRSRERAQPWAFTYTMYESTGTEAYTVYAGAAFPRVMLREDLPGKLVSTLVKAEP